jgi:hypothetical protein
MNMTLGFKYDLVFTDTNGKERGLENFTSSCPVSAGDLILWHGCELKVVRAIHFVDGQRPTLECEILTKEK